MIEFEFLRKSAGDWDYEDPYQGQVPKGPQDRSQPQHGRGQAPDRDENLRQEMIDHLMAPGGDTPGHGVGTGDERTHNHLNTKNLQQIIDLHDAVHDRHKEYMEDLNSDNPETDYPGRRKYLEDRDHIHD